MRAVVQRVSRAKVTVADEITGEIATGLLVLLGVEVDDTDSDCITLAKKVAGLRIFEDHDGKMNLSVQEIGGGILVVSQFTLLGDCAKGRRPSFIRAARPEQADQLYRAFVAELRGMAINVATGRFQQHMEVELNNSGPVTLLLDTRREL